MAAWQKAIAATLLTVSLVAGAPSAMAKVNEPTHKVVQKDENIEIRQYGASIVAEVTVTGNRRGAVNDGFRLLADYIFGNNQPQEKIAMTAPVTQAPLNEGESQGQSQGQGTDAQASKGEKIAMTAPVTQAPQGALGDTGQWTVQFFMPEDYTMETLPLPVKEEVVLKEVPARTIAALRFSGVPNMDGLKRRQQELEAYLKGRGIEAIGEATFAYYDPPWTLPFMRRNEVLIPVAYETGDAPGS